MENKNNVGKYLILIVVLLVGIAIGFLICSTLTTKDKCKVDNTVTKTEELTDKEQIDKKLDVILRGNLNVNVHSPILEKTRNVEDFESDDLVSLLFVADYDKFDRKSLDGDYCYDIKNKKLLQGSDCVSEEYILDELNSSFELQQFAEAYKKLYGLSLDKDYYKGCPEIIIDRIESKIYTRTQCGGTGGIYHRYYRYKYEQEGNYYYVYVAVGFGNPSGLYTDYEMTNLPEYHSSINDLNEYNYDKYSKYKISFEKVDGEYHFTKVEKL